MITSFLAMPFLRARDGFGTMSRAFSRVLVCGPGRPGRDAWQPGEIAVPRRRFLVGAAWNPYTVAAAKRQPNIRMCEYARSTGRRDAAEAVDQPARAKK
jgi:hypothetical protein